MNPRLRKTVAAVVLAVSAFNVLAPTVVSAITLDSILGQAQTGLANNEGTQNACLTASYVQQLNQYYNNRQSQIEAIGQQVLQKVQSQIQQLAFCLIGAAFGFSSALRCTADLKNDMEKYAKEDLKKKIIDDAKARAQARCMLDDTTDKMRRVMKENGRDGGPTYPESYRDVLLSAEARGRAIARNNICSTAFCPWIAQDMYSLYNCSPDDVVPLTDPVEDGGQPFTQEAACSFGPSVISSDLTGRPDLLFQLTLPQNNIWGTYLMAEKEVAHQIAMAQEADRMQLEANNGHFGVEGECTKNKEGVCLTPGRVKTPGSSLDNADQAIVQAELDWVTGSKEVNQLLADTSAKIVSRLIDAGFSEIPTQLELDSFANDPPPPPPPPPPQTPVQYVDPDAPGLGEQSCTPDDSKCTCVIDDATYQEQARSILDEMGRAALQNPDIVVGVPPNSTVLPGRNADYIAQVCFQLGSDPGRACRVDPRHDDVIVLGTGQVDVAIDIIRANGGIRFGNPTAKFTCQAGVI